MRSLIFGAMPAGATPATHIASGPWCFAGQEASFPGWDESGGFPMPPDPFADAADMERTARAANGQAARLIRIFGGGTDNGEPHGGTQAEAAGFSKGSEGTSGPSGQDSGPSGQTGERSGKASGFVPAFSNPLARDILFGPFLLLCAHMLAERQKRVRDLVDLYGGEALRVELLPGDCAFAFADSLDFMVHGVQDRDFNHYVFSRIVEAAPPAAWELTYLSARPLHAPAKRPSPGFSARCRDAARQWLRKMPFPRARGFSLPQSLLLSLAVLLNRRRVPDRTIPFAAYAGEPLSWDFPAEPLIAACLPQPLRGVASPLALAELSGSVLPSSPRHKRFGGTGKKGGGSFFFPGPLRPMLPLFSQSEPYRLELARRVEAGARLFSIQHGANYGNLRCPGVIPFEYSRHAFFSWGFERHGDLPLNARPLPHPSLASIAGRHQEKAEELILVGTEMSPYAYRLKSRPLAGAMLEYRKAKVDFFRALGAEVGSRAFYRPYFHVAGGLDDAAYVRRKLPGTALCEGDLTERMLGCRLLVLDHYGTTLHMALAADVPTLAFWDRRGWGMTVETEELLEELRRAGIFFDYAAEAAEQAARVWNNVPGWWRSAPVRAARALWLDRYARCLDAEGRPLSARAVTRQWFAALRDC